MFLSQFEIFCDLNRPIETWNSSVLYIKDIFLNEANLMFVLQLIDEGRTGGGGPMAEIYTMDKLVRVLHDFGVVVSNPNCPFMFF